MGKVQRISSLGSGTRITQPGGKATVRQKMGKHFHTTEALFPQDMDYYGFICPGRGFYLHEELGFKSDFGLPDLPQVAS